MFQKIFIGVLFFFTIMALNADIAFGQTAQQIQELQEFIDAKRDLLEVTEKKSQKVLLDALDYAEKALDKSKAKFFNKNYAQYQTEKKKWVTQYKIDNTNKNNKGLMNLTQEALVKDFIVQGEKENEKYREFAAYSVTMTSAKKAEKTKKLLDYKAFEKNKKTLIEQIEKKKKELLEYQQQVQEAKEKMEKFKQEFEKLKQQNTSTTFYFDPGDYQNPWRTKPNTPERKQEEAEKQKAQKENKNPKK